MKKKHQFLFFSFFFLKEETPISKTPISKSQQVPYLTQETMTQMQNMATATVTPSPPPPPPCRKHEKTKLQVSEGSGRELRTGIRIEIVGVSLGRRKGTVGGFHRRRLLGTQTTALCFIICVDCVDCFCHLCCCVLSLVM